MKNIPQRIFMMLGVLGICISVPQISIAGTVTVTAVVMAEQGDGSSWDVGQGADIILCGAAGCYVSNGLEKAATFYEGRGGFRLIKKAGECRDSFKCVFRGVDLEKLQGDKSYNVQLVDVDYVSHNYMALSEVRGSSNCSVNSARLECGRGVHEQDYSLWVIDEQIAERAGVAGLDYALFKGVQAQRSKELLKRLNAHRMGLRVSALKFYKLVVKRELAEKCQNDINFLSETFYVMGLADATKRRAEYILKELIGREPIGELAGLIRNKPQLYWAFLDVAKQFKIFAGAPRSERRDGVLNLKIETGEGNDKLLYGWKVEARAKAAFESCSQSIEKAESKQ